jgi:murein DD-endopeptidase MepM/ murein hydrolase activator NlpD
MIRTLLLLLVATGLSAAALPVPHKAWERPVQGVLMNPFGNSYVFYGYDRSGHTGVDLATAIGTPVHAAADGVVRKVVTTPNMRYGNYLVIEHAEAPYHTLYGHLQHIYVTEGESVKAGRFIGASGMSGLASYPHVHFEVLDRVPEHDGAWGYRYICQANTQSIQMLNKTSWGPVAGLAWLKGQVGHLGQPSMQMHSYLREHTGACRERPIAPLTYFNPERFLPAYPHGQMPDLSGLKR